MNESNVQQLTWGFRANNPLDWIEKELFTRAGVPVTISRFDRFVVKLDGKTILSTDDNNSVCYWLNLNEVGVKQS